MHLASITAFLMAVIGFVLGFFAPWLGGTWLSANFLLGSIALALFLILRESTLSHIRGRGGADPGPSATGGRYQAARSPAQTAGLPPEAATTQSLPAAPPAGGPGAYGPRPPSGPRQ